MLRLSSSAGVRLAARTTYRQSARMMSLRDPMLGAEAEEAELTGNQGPLLVSLGQSSFNLADLDANGTLDKTEFKALVRYVGLGWEDARIEQTFQSIDANSDGVIQPHEWQVAITTGLDPEARFDPALAAEAEEAEHSGHLPSDARTLAEKVQAFMGDK